MCSLKKRDESLITISIVSHGQISLVKSLLSDLNDLYKNDFEVILTLNIPEVIPQIEKYNFPILILKNNISLGFGANHNRAFAQSNGGFFAVVNPDIRAKNLCFEYLRAVMSDSSIGACGPLVVNSKGEVEDSARKFPTFYSLLLRILTRGRKSSVDYQLERIGEPIDVDWVGGMFMLFRSSAFSLVKGFDEYRFYMYFEDVDICRRLHAKGLSILIQPKTFVIHDAQKSSHTNVRYLSWHLTSAFRYLTGL